MFFCHEGTWHVIKITPGLSRALERRLIQKCKKSSEILPKPDPHLPGDRDLSKIVNFWIHSVGTFSLFWHIFKRRPHKMTWGPPLPCGCNLVKYNESMVQLVFITRFLINIYDRTRKNQLWKSSQQRSDYRYWHFMKLHFQCSPQWK